MTKRNQINNDTHFLLCHIMILQLSFITTLFHTE